MIEDRPDMAPGTIKAYRSQWRLWAEWAAANGCESMPADPARIAEYLTERHERDGTKPASLGVAAAAIGHVHGDHGLVNPCSHPVVKRTLKGIRRTAGGGQRQARALNADGVDAIIATAFKPRSSRLETPIRARARGARDIAIVLVMRDAMLRVGEAAALRWGDIEAMPDGSGRLTVRRSKTDQYGSGAVLYLSPAAMTALAWLDRNGDRDGRVFGLEANQIALCIKAACAAAGLGQGFSGHSPRVGMAQDLARAGVELPALMTAGRWSSPKMAAHYTRNETADRGAVAQWHRAQSAPATVVPPSQPEPPADPEPRPQRAKPTKRQQPLKAKAAPRKRATKPKPDPKPTGPSRRESLVLSADRRAEARLARRETARQRVIRRTDSPG